MVSGNVMGPKLYEWQAYGFSYENAGQQLNRPNQRHCDDASGKDMGSRWQGYGFCRMIVIGPINLPQRFSPLY
jgi:hypothetical protein